MIILSLRSWIFKKKIKALYSFFKVVSKTILLLRKFSWRWAVIVIVVIVLSKLVLNLMSKLLYSLDEEVLKQRTWNWLQLWFSTKLLLRIFSSFTVFYLWQANYFFVSLLYYFVLFGFNFVVLHLQSSIYSMEYLNESLNYYIDKQKEN